MRTIEVIISPTGESKLETKGFGGDACREASLFLEQALGTKAKEERTAEFFAEAAVSATVNSQAQH